MPQHNEESQSQESQTVIPAERDVRLLNAFLATAALALANDIAEDPDDDDPSQESDMSPELVGVAMGLMGVASCAANCTEPGCPRTARIADWISEAVAHVDGGDTLAARTEINEFMEELVAEDDDDDLAPPALLN